MSTHLVERSCPVCGSNPNQSRSEVVAKIPAENLGSDQLADVFIGLRREQVFFTYVRCRECDLLWCPIYFSQDFLDSLYQSMPPNNKIYGERSSERTQRNYANVLELPSWPTNSTFVEIGCDEGILSNEILSRRPDLRVLAIEPNKSVHSQIKRSLGERGEIVESIADIDFNRNISNALAIHVLDHLVEPRSVLEDLGKRLERNASIWSVVHNEQTILRKLLQRRWPPFSPQHPQLFSPTTVSVLFRSLGFEATGVTRTTNLVNLRDLARSALSLTSISPRFSLLIPRIESKVYFGNILCCASRS
jgi:hypothetical protein